MTAKEAILQAALRALSQPDFDRAGIPDVDHLVDQLKDHSAQLEVSHPFEHARGAQHLSQPCPVRRRGRGYRAQFQPQL